MKFIFGMLLIVAALGTGYYLGFDHGWEGGVKRQVSPDTTENTSAQRPDFQWIVETTDSEDGNAPTSKVMLRVNGEVREIGTYQLSCNEQTAGALDTNQISRVICWWGGGGYELGIFEENGVYVVKQGDIDEGTAEEGGFRGNFKVLLFI